MNEYVEIKKELRKLRNNKNSNLVIARPYKTIKQNIIWFLSMTNETTNHIDMAKILNLKPDGIKKAFSSIMKSSYALQFISKELINNRNIYTNTIPVGINIFQFVKNINKTVDKTIREKPIYFVERLKNLNIEIPYDAGFHCIVHFLQRAGSRGLTDYELLESFGVTTNHELLDPGIMKHGLTFINREFKNWNVSYLVNMYDIRIINDKTYHFLTQGFDLHPRVFTIIAKGTFEPQIKMEGKTVNSTTQVHDKKTSLSVEYYNKRKVG